MCIYIYAYIYTYITHTYSILNIQIYDSMNVRQGNLRYARWKASALGIRHLRWLARVPRVHRRFSETKSGIASGDV